MKKFFSFFAAMLFAGSMMAADYQLVTEAPANWEGEYVLVASEGGVNYAFSGVDAVNGYTAVTVADDIISDYTGVTVTIEANESAYALKVNGGDNDGKYMSSGSSAPSYSNALKFIDAKHAVEVSINADSTVVLKQTATGGDVTMRFNNASDQKRFRFYKSGQKAVYLYKKVEDAQVNYWLVGTAAENEWDQTKAMPMAGDQIVRHLAAGTYAFKVLVAEGSWTGALNASNVNAEASSANWYGDDNVCFELENEGDVTIAVVDGQIVLTGNFKEQAAYDYYIKFAGNGWNWVGMTLEEGAYVYAGVWGGTGANVNTSNTDGGATWFAENSISFQSLEGLEAPVAASGTEGKYVYDVTASTLAFKYDYVSTALKNTTVAPKAQKVIENGKVVIVREGVRYNAQGIKF